MAVQPSAISAPPRRRLPIKDAMAAIVDAEIDRLLDNARLVKETVTSCEQRGIIFIDEIDKIARASSSLFPSTVDASAVSYRGHRLTYLGGCST